MTVATLLVPEYRWVCPNCTTTAVKRGLPKPGENLMEMHHCPGMVGVYAPMVADGVRCKVEAVERGDYVNGDLVQTNAEGRPISAIVTTRDDGQDTAVLAPTATAVRMS